MNKETERGFFSLWVLVAIIAGLWILWYFTGGPERAANQGEHPFLKAPSPIDSGETYGVGQ